MAKAVLVPQRQEWYAAVPHTTRSHTTFGFVFLGVLVGGFGLWANEAPIAGAIVTSGVFVASGEDKTVQHLEGGVIKEILVKEGDLVQRGQLLIRLDDTTPRAELHRLLLKHDQLAAVEARLLAEVHGDDSVTYPEPSSSLDADDYRTTVHNQDLEFTAHRANLASDTATLQDGIEALEEKVRGSQQQKASTQQQIDLLNQEFAGKSSLLKLGEVRKPEVLAIQRAIANAEGEIGRLDGDIGDARERIARTREEIIGVRNAAAKTASEQLNEMHAEGNDVRERIRSASAVLSRVEITAPVRGIVVKLRYHTPGGVVEPGKSILEIVPAGDELVIEARVRPEDISNLRVGQFASVRLTALSQRVTPMVAGEVIYVSADTLPDERRMQAMANDQYVARIRLDPESTRQVHEFAPVPGMPAEVYIKTGDHTFFQYLVKPLHDSMQRAFREK
jgi:HlyD family secretion protein